jgi:hypothetical protein
MVRKAPACRRSRLDGCLRYCVWFWACLWVIALSAPLEARADPPVYAPPADVATEPALGALRTCPVGGLEPYEGEDDAASELRSLRDEQAEVCHALVDRQDAVVRRLWWIVAEQLAEHGKATISNERLAAVVEALAGSLKTELQGIDVEHPLPVSAEGSVEVTNPPDVAAVKAAVVDNSETFVSNVWGLAGLFVGLGALVWLFKLVRP